MEQSTTQRGFSLGKFTDRYNHECSIQHSSLATEDCIWLGISKAKPIIMKSHAERLNLDMSSYGEGEGWMEYKLPDEVNISTRMHLTQEMAGELAVQLKRFSETGRIFEDEVYKV
jgi:hypothetical protein